MPAMPEPRLTPEEIDRLAHKRAGAKMGWYMHAAVYVVVNAAMYLMASSGWRDRSWTPQPMVFWGIGLALHWVSVFVVGKGSALRQRLVQRERDRLEREQRDARP
jgi:hypothetical protein